MYESSSENSSRACATAVQRDPVFVISFVEVPASTETSVGEVSQRTTGDSGFRADWAGLRAALVNNGSLSPRSSTKVPPPPSVHAVPWAPDGETGTSIWSQVL